MLGHLTIILLCQLAGEIIAKAARLPVPGPVIGMVILFSGLMLRGTMSPELENVAGLLHRYLPLLFVPAGVGVITSLDLLARSWAPLAGAIIIGTGVTIAVTGLVMQLANRRARPDQQEAPHEQ
ncbi:CidA/LrgA family protein [Trichlorobacter lovleyi]|uniref:CidA/LrgA family protein n=1 Tax=Trichlorobacter lovleyi TaxID=313985 RepID=UPI00223FAA48|nr:CidA/LrgA family protein [Trichlorobacter lovleyi]QOX77521.1 CidA/LrgA family protein [Trichlorobacter lovleyi]